jgi:hypothetical protein
MPTSFSRAGIFTSEALQQPEKYKQNFDISSEGPSCKKLVAITTTQSAERCLIIVTTYA